VPAECRRSRAWWADDRVEDVGGKKRVTYAVASATRSASIARRFDVHVNDLGNWNDVLSRGTSE